VAVGWGAAAALVAGVSLAATAGEAAEVWRIEATPVAAGARVQVVTSAPVRATVREVASADGPARRLYLELPRGTRIATGSNRPREAVPPLEAVRFGLTEDGSLRIVLELDGAGGWQVVHRGRVLGVLIARVTTEPPPSAKPAVEPASGRARGVRIVLDPGHGGDDPGARGFAVEKEVTLDIASRLAGFLRERLGAEVVLTRRRDATLPLAARTARANAEGADLFLSIHANASRNPRLRGIETYYLNNTNDRASIRLAAMENGLAQIGPLPHRADLRFILSDLVQVGKMEESVALARAVQRSLVSHLRRRYSGVNDLGVKRGPFYVLVGAYMPCVLVETSFLSHPAEGRRLATEKYRAEIAEGLYAGVERFLADTRRARTL
jgi:N-acetylmuramoyl-L-alanine amidase